MPLILVHDDIVHVEADAIVTSTDCHFSDDGEVNGSIRKAGGPALGAELQKYDCCEVGDAIITGPGSPVNKRL